MMIASFGFIFYFPNPMWAFIIRGTQCRTAILVHGGVKLPHSLMWFTAVLIIFFILLSPHLYHAHSRKVDNRH